VGLPAEHSFKYDPTPYQTVPGSNRLASVGIQSYTHSAAGHVTNNGQTAFTYDGRERLVSATRAGQTTAYAINGLGERVKKAGPVTGTVRFLYDDEGRLIGEYDQAGSAIQEYFYYQDSPVMILKGAQVYYITPDHLGTPRAVVQMPVPVQAGSTWKTVWRWEGEAFGGSLPSEDPDGDGTPFKLNLRFPGQYFDQETGLHYNYYRDYDPQIGRYVQSDPIGLSGGINTYLYVGANPLTAIDPFGLAKFCCRVLNSIAGQSPSLGIGIGQKHCYVVADDGTAYGLYPTNLRGVQIGVPRTNDPRDVGGECFDCPQKECTNQNECLRNAHRSYPRSSYPNSSYSVLGPNSNTYAATMARNCCAGGVPPGVRGAPGINDAPPTPR